MFIEDPILRKSRERIRACIAKQFEGAGTRHYVSDKMFDILQIICEFYDGDTKRIYTLDKKDRERILEIMNFEGIHFTNKEFHSLRSVVRLILKERYRSLDICKYPDDLPPRTSVYEIMGEYCFDDFLCLNDTDVRVLDEELEEWLYGREDRLISILDECRNGHPFQLLPATKNLLPYKRLRMLDEIFVEYHGFLTVEMIDWHMRRQAKKYGLDYDSLWKINSYDDHQRRKVDLDNRYVGDLAALAELIQPSDRRKGNRRDDVFLFDGFGGRCYRHPGMSAFKLVMTAKNAEKFYHEVIRIIGGLRKLDNWRHPLIYAIAAYGRHHREQSMIKARKMKNYGSARVVDYGEDFDGNSLFGIGE